MGCYTLRKTGGMTKYSGRLPTFKGSERLLCEFTDVNLSHGGIIWRGEHAINTLVDISDLHRPSKGMAVIDPTVYLKGTYFMARTSCSAHSHLMDETLGSLHFADRYHPNIKLLASDALTKSQREYFELLGFPPERCIYKPVDETWQVERLVVPLPRSCSDRQSDIYLKKIGIYYYDKNAKRPDRIYISRRDSLDCRNLVNGEEIEEIFASRGFSIILASKLSAKEKIEIFSTARYVAGPFGTAFHYMQFSMHGVAIMLTSSLLPPYVNTLYGWSLRKSYTIYGVSLKSLSVHDGGDFRLCSFYLPPELAISALDDIIKNG